MALPALLNQSSKHHLSGPVASKVEEIQMTINEFLQSLKPSGDGSFEDLLGELLGTLTGLRFYAARSGDQGGRDGRAAGLAGGDIVFECKRYSGETALRDRELIGELARAHQRLPQLDMWIIAASREITDQNVSGLEAFGKQHGIDVLALESLEPVMNFG